MNGKELNEEELRKRLATLLQTGKLDFGKLLDLSARIAALDPKYVRFTVDAGLINRLGKELVGRKETAVSELVKNCYDADATAATITFENPAMSKARIIISDDGEGMTREQLVNGFLRLSSTDKIDHPRSNRYDRIRAGRKGIGRFAAQRLGKKLSLITQPVGVNHSFHVDFDWAQFQPAMDLTHIGNEIRVEKKLSEPGTTLIIEDLADNWTSVEIAAIYEDLLELLQPFRLEKKNPPISAAAKEDPGFLSEIYIQSSGSREQVRSELTNFKQYALATIEGYVSDDGSGLWSIDSKKLGIKDSGRIGPESANPKSKYSALRNVYFKTYYYIFLPPYLQGAIRNSLKSYAQQHGGIRLYRNGFRVRPYGELRDDWLGLDLSSRMRQILPPHSNF